MNRERLATAIGAGAVAGLLLGLGACANTPFHGAAAMRVEVEVYKGPLSKEPEIQWGEFKALVREASHALTAFNDALLVAANFKAFPTFSHGDWPDDDDGKGADDDRDLGVKSPGKFPRPSTSIQRVITKPDGDGSDNSTPVDFCGGAGWPRELYFTLFTPDTYTNCLIMAQIRDDVSQLLVRIGAIEIQLDDVSKRNDDVAALDSNHFRGVLVHAAEVSTIMKSKAFYWAEAHAGAAPGDRATRATMAGFANLVSEYSNQIGSRADALLKQFEGEGRPRQELATSVFLRDAPTDFLNLYTWNRAVAPALIEEMILHPTTAFTSEETADRVRVVERLFADHQWSKVNTVYASGRGEVAMVLVKDDIGNWNLKSFDADPTELVDAYTELTMAGLDAAIKAVKAGATGGGGAALDSVLSTASQLTRGRIGGQQPTAGGLNVDSLHQRAADRLDALKSRAKAADVELAKATMVAETAAAVAKSDADHAEAAVGEKPDPNALTAVPGDEGASTKANILSKSATTKTNAKIETVKAIEIRLKAERILSDNSAATGHVLAKGAKDLSDKAVEAAREASDLAERASVAANGLPDISPNADQAKTAHIAAINGVRALNYATALGKAAKDRLTAASAAVTAAREKAAQVAHGKKVLAEARAILDDHAAIIDVLQEGAVPASSADATPTASAATNLVTLN